MSHRARSALASPPVEIADRVADVVGIAFQRWADRFVSAVMRSVVEPSDRFKQDATVQGVFTEAGRARPDPDRLRSAFTMLESKSADDLRVTGVSARDVVVGGERLQQQWLRQNTDLIKAEQDLRRRVERVLQDPLNQGRSVAEIAKLLEEQVGYSRSRAELTARDQTLKMYSQIQEQRQRAAGITRYVWTTSLDERVREDHAALDGSVQSWDDPPIVDKRTGRREHPGRDFQCRCTAVPILDEDDVADPQVAQEQRQAAANAEAEGRFRRPSTGGAPPPPEPVMAPTPADVERQAEAARVEAERRAAEAAADRRIEAARVEAERRAAEAARVEAERRAAEAAADRRIAEQRAALAEAQAAERLRAAPPALAPFTPAEMVAAAEDVQISRAARGVAPAQIEAAVERAVAGKSLQDLTAIPFTAEDLASDQSLRFLRADPTFRQTGNVADNFGRSRGGLPQITIEPDGSVHLTNGRHRLTVAREIGLRQIQARVRKVGKRGGELWEYVGLIRV